MKIQESTLHILDSIIKEDNLSHGKYAKRTKDFLNILPEGLSHDSRVLDIGLATGYFSVLLRSEIECEVHGIDVQREGDSENQQRWLSRYDKFDIKFQYCDITKEKLPYPNEYFDLIIFLEVLEHLIVAHPPLGILRAIKRVLRKNGIFILSTPNAVSLDSRIACLVGIHPSSYGFKDSQVHSKHLREYTRCELQWTLEQCGFKVLEARFENQSPPPHGFLSMLINVFQSYIPNFRNTIIVKAKKSGD